jgi:nicotinamidase-related amidase
MPTESLLLCAGDSALAIIDVQDKLTAAMPAEAREMVVRNGRLLLEAAARLNVPVLVTEQYRKGLGGTVAGLSELFPTGAPNIEKTCFSCAASPDFTEALDGTGRKQAVLAGMESHVCVLQSALELRAAGRQVFVVEDACCSRSPRNHENALHRLRAAGVVVTSTESVLFEWLRDSRHEQFKTLSARLR